MPENIDSSAVETVVRLSLSELHPFPEHPFAVRSDDAMNEAIQSIREYGVLVPILVRPREEGGYEIISGHRRKHACEAVGLNTIPAIVRNIDRDEATIIMVDSNLQRENILPSERAKAYKMKLEAIKRQGERRDLTCTQVGYKLKSVQKVAEEAGESATQIQRFIRLTELSPELQKMVDNGKMGITPAVEISYLPLKEQSMLLETMDSEQTTPSLSQAQRMKKLSREGKLDDDKMLEIMTEQKKPEVWNLTIPMEKIMRFFPRSYTPKQMEATIFKLLEGWTKKRSQSHER